MTAVKTIAQPFVEEAKQSVQECRELSERDLWSQHGPTIWRTRRFVGNPHFYPVYKYKDLYSYSLFSLIMLKGRLDLNKTVAKKVATWPREQWYYSGTDTLDCEIVRVGSPIKPKLSIKWPEEYAERLADAMRKDIAAIEYTHPGVTNVILCGGKDSLNLLLLPWRNPVLVVSAAPNYDLVKSFIKDNALAFDVELLEDADDSLLPLEVMVNVCRNNLEHCRWGPALRAVSERLSKQCIFWKGQLGAQVMPPQWKAYTHHGEKAMYQMHKYVGCEWGKR